MKLINSILLAMLFLSCSRVLSEETGEDGICFYSNIRELQSIHVGRAGFNDGDNIHLYIASRVDAGIPKLPVSEDLHEMICDDSGSLSFQDGEEHNYPDVPIDVYGYYWKGSHPQPSDMAEMAVHVQVNQETRTAMEESDFLYVKAANGYMKDVNPIQLEFSHLFSKLVLNLKTLTPSTINLEGIEKMIARNLIVDGAFNLGTGELTNGEIAEEIQMEKVKTSSVIVLPQEIEEGHVLFTFKLPDMEDVDVPIPANSFEGGKEYTYNVTVNRYPGMGAVEMSFSVSIKDWVSEYSWDVAIESGEKAIVTLKDISNGVEINKADLFFSSGDFIREVKNIPVTDGKMQFIFPRLTPGGTLQLDKARFYAGTGEEGFDYYFTDKILKGNNRDSISLTAPRVGDAWGGGTIFLVGKVTSYDEETSSFITNTTGINAYRGRVVADILLEKLKWCEEKLPVLVGATDKNDGYKNFEAVKKYAGENNKTLDFFPAFKACEDLGKGWYYPALNEMKYIIAHRDEVNVNIGKQGGVLIEDAKYGTSTEGKNTDYTCSDKTPNSKNIAIDIRAARAY